MKNEEVLLILNKLKECQIEDRTIINYILFLDDDIKELLVANIENSNFKNLINIIWEYKGFDLKTLLDFYLNAHYDIDDIIFNKEDSLQARINKAKLVMSATSDKKAEVIKKILSNYAENDLVMVVNIINEASSDTNVEYIYNILTNLEMLKYNIAIKGAEIISRTNKEYVKYIYDVLTNSTAIRNGKAIEIAEYLSNIDDIIHIECVKKLVFCEKLLVSKNFNTALEVLAKAKQDFNKKNVTRALTNTKFLEIDKAIEIATILNEATKEDNADYVYDLFENGIILKKDFTFLVNVAKIINKSISSFSSKVICDLALNEANDILLEAFKIISECNNIIKVSQIKNLITNNKALEANIALEGAKIIKETKYETNSKYICRILCSEFAINNGLALEMASLVSDIKNGCISEVIANILCTNNACDKDLIVATINIIKELNIIDAEYISTMLKNAQKYKNNEILLQIMSLIPLAPFQSQKEIISYIGEFIHNDNISEYCKQVLSCYDEIKLSVFSDAIKMYPDYPNLTLPIIKILNDEDLFINLNIIYEVLNTEEKVTDFYNYVSSRLPKDKLDFNKLNKWNEIMNLLGKKITINSMYEGEVQGKASYLDSVMKILEKQKDNLNLTKSK